MNNIDLKELFTAHRVDIPDEGFSERLIRQLPERSSMLPQIVMSSFIFISLAILFAIHDVAPVIEQINSLTASISQMQIPSPSAIITYVGLLSFTGLIGFSVAGAN